MATVRLEAIRLGAALDQYVLALGNRAPFQVRRVGSVFWPYFDRSGPIPTSAEGISTVAVDSFRARYRRWLDAGIYFPPSAYEVGFLSSAHTPEHLARLVDALATQVS